MFELHAIERACQRVPGSLKKISIVDPADLATPAKWNVSQSLDNLDFLPGKSAYIFEKDLLSGRLEGETDTGSIAGDFFNYRLTATVRAIRPTVESFRAKLVNRRVHIVATYQDDLQRLVPYMRLSARDDSGAQWGDRQGYTFNGSGRLLMPGPGIGGNIEEGGTGGGSDPTPAPGGVDPIVIATTGSTYTYLIQPGKWLVGIELRSDTDQTVSVGLTPGGDEFGGTMDMVALQPWTIQGNSIPTFNSTNIYFSGLAGSNTIKLWLLG